MSVSDAVSNSSDGRCGSIARLLGAHADGQLDAAKTLEVDDHLVNCETCRERTALDRAIRGSLKRTTKTAAPDDMRARMLASMKRAGANAEAADAKAASDTGAKRPAMLRHWRTMIPVASAAALALAWGFAGQQPLARTDFTSRLGAGFGNDDLVNQFVDIHSRPIRPETSDPKEVRAFEREVGVPVHVPQLRNAHFVGARLLPLQGGERALMMQYEVDDVTRQNGPGQRVSVFVYDPRRVQIHNAEQVTPRPYGTAQVRMAQSRGYSVAVAQHGAVGYAVASDLEDSSAQYALAVDRE